MITAGSLLVMLISLTESVRAAAAGQTQAYFYGDWVPKGCTATGDINDDFNRLLRICQCADGSDSCNKLAQDAVVFKEWVQDLTLFSLNDDNRH